MTPEQMRVLAERLSQMAESQAMDFDAPHVAMTLNESAATLRSVADQLEAVQRWNHRDGYHLANREARRHPHHRHRTPGAEHARRETRRTRIADSDEPARPDSLPFPHAKADKMLAPQEGRDE